MLDCVSKLTLLKSSFQLNDLDVILEWNVSDFDPELVTSICQRNQLLQHLHIATLPSKENGLIKGCDFDELLTATETISSKQSIPIGWKTHLGQSLCGREIATKPNDANTIHFTSDNLLFQHMAEWMKTTWKPWTF